MDPLSGFSSLIRTLWRDRTERASARGSADPAQSSDPSTREMPPTPAGQASDLRERLRERLSPLRMASRERRCEVFVETVLHWELGERAAADPRFAEVVTRVARELTTEPQIGARLEELLTELTGPMAR